MTSAKPRGSNAASPATSSPSPMLITLTTPPSSQLGLHRDWHALSASSRKAPGLVPTGLLALATPKQARLHLSRQPIQRPRRRVHLHKHAEPCEEQASHCSATIVCNGSRQAIMCAVKHLHIKCAAHFRGGCTSYRQVPSMRWQPRTHPARLPLNAPRESTEQEPNGHCRLAHGVEAHRYVDEALV
jgi:hypothetical protein